MATVFIVTEGYDYESSDVTGVYYYRASAVAFVESRGYKQKTSREDRFEGSDLSLGAKDYAIIEEHEIK